MLGRTIPGTITKTGNGDILEKSVGINDGLSRFGSIFLKFLVNTSGVKDTLVFSNDSLPFICLEDTDKDIIHINKLHTITLRMDNLLVRNQKNILRNGSPHGYIHPSVVDHGPTHCNKNKNIKIQVVHHAFHLVTISGSVIS